MRRSPSIVPGHDQDVYLVLDDFGGLRSADERPMSKTPICKPSSTIYWEASTATPFAALASTLRRDGRGTFRRTWPTSCAVGVRSRAFLPVSVEEFVERCTERTEKARFLAAVA